MIISLRKFLPYLPSHYKKPFPLPLEIMDVITGLAYVTLLTEEFGSMMKRLKNICNE
jgi:hypothetical protein